MSKERRWPRRLARLTVWGLAVAAVLLFVVILVLESDWARETGRSIVVREAGEALGREVAIESLDFDVIPPRASVTGLTIGGPEGLGDPFASVEQASVRLGVGLLATALGDGPVQLAEIEIVGAWAGLVFDGEGGSNLPDLPERDDAEPGRGVKIGTLRVRESRLDIDESTLPLEFSAVDVLTSVTGRPEGGLAGRAEIGRFDLSLQEGPDVSGGLSVLLQADDSGLLIRRGRLEAPAFEADFEGSYRDETLVLETIAKSRGAFLASAGLTDLLEGELSARASFEATFGEGEDGWGLTATLSAPAVSLAEGSELGRALPEAAGLPANVSLRLKGDRDGLQIRRGRLEAEGLEVDFDGVYRERRLTLEASARSSGAFLASAGLAELIEGEFSTDATFEMVPGDEAVDWSLTADIAAPALLLAERRVTGIEARVEANAARLEARIEQARFAEADVSGTVTMPLGRDDPPIDLDFFMAGLDLDVLLDREDAPIDGVDARLDARLAYRFHAAAPLAGDGSARVEIEPVGHGRGVPLTGAFPASLRGGVLHIDSARLSAPRQTIEIGGDVDLEALSADLSLAFETSDPRELLHLMPGIYVDDPEPLWEPVQGEGRMWGDLRVDPEGFEADLEIDLESAIISGAPIASVEGSVSIDPAGLRIPRMDLSRDESALGLVASIPFGDVAGYEAPAFEVGLDIQSWPLGEAAPWLPFELPFGGIATGRLDLGGSLEAPSGSLDATVVELRSGEMELESDLAGTIRFDPERVELSPVRLTAPSGWLEVDGAYAFETEAVSMTVASGPLDLAAEPFATLVAGYLSGAATLNGEVTGTLSQPELSLVLEGDDLALPGGALGRAGDSRFEISLVQDQLEVSGSLLGLVRVQGGGAFEWGETMTADLSIGIETERVSELLEVVTGSGPEDLAGRVKGVVEIASAPTSPLEARLRLDVIELDHLGSHLQAAEPAVVELRDGEVDLDLLYLVEKGSGSDLVAHGTLFDADGEMELFVASTVNAGWLDVYLPDLDLAGEMHLLAAVRGPATAPEIDGQAALMGGRFIVADFPHAIEKIEGLVFFYPDLVVVDSATATMAGGRITAQGSFSSDEEQGWGYELQFLAEDLDLRYPEDWRLRGDAELTLSSVAGGRLLSGIVEVDRASFVRDFEIGLSSLLKSMFAHTAVIVQETDPFLVETRLNIRIVGPGALHIESNLASLEGGLDLTLQGNLAQPVVAGDVRLARGGRIDLGGNRYRIERGDIAFTNPFRTDPNLDIVASSQISQYDIRVNIFGPLDDIQTSVSSTPPLADLDVLSLMATGSTDSLGSVGTPRDGRAAGDGGVASAEAFLVSQASSLAGQRFGELLGLDQIQVSPLTGSSADLSAARVTVGKRLSRDVYVTYSYDPSRNDETVFELSWQVHPAVSIVFTRSGRGDSYSMDVRWDKTF